MPRPSALCAAATDGNTAEVEKLLSRPGTKIEARNSFGDSALHIASYKGHREIVEILLDTCAEVNAKTTRGETSLHLAAQEGHGAIAQLLLENGADANLEKPFDGGTALHHAAAHGNGVIVQILLDNGSDINLKATDGRAALHYAVERGLHGDVAMVTQLLDNGADINVKKGKGYTPLHTAVQRKDLPMVQLLLDKGADVCGCVPEDIASTFAIAALLRVARVAARRKVREAFAMVLHERLGATSLVRGLDEEVLRMILDLA
mmetsp:Transcript_13444/g.32677  ORF Transcript_13444/g.32677 Transcript_13444/m.32677 type:complete len:262 (-) Transcript_13444:133-918(-)|eukprot:CAMPEP_0180130522 /NCGR_PEP_ID=MMETSP0986-20121125/7915_1 /TAXON_ID=697907 /ORGANISM="non described non described, Strain CCMP2293" /LENGTH=261 /DNA_ID=CAMNT_0022070305 /DNA_START=66 /DNA_END=851 /DNA_ORIENTATION=+